MPNYNVDLASALQQSGRMAQWAEAVKFNAINLSDEDKVISEAMDAYLKETVGKTGNDPQCELSALITRTLTPEVVEGPSELIDTLFDNGGSVGEFDDVRWEIEPKNTIQVFDSIAGGNVNRSYVDFSYMKGHRCELQAETEISLQEIRRGGYRTVAYMIQNIRDALDQKKMAKVMSVLDGVVVSGGANYIEETEAIPTEASMDKLSLYLMDVATGDGELMAFGQNRYLQPVVGYDKAIKYATEGDKNFFNQHGMRATYSGIKLQGYSGLKKMADGNLVMPNGVVFGTAGKIGSMVTRGETRVYQETDINSEKIHIKVNGYAFDFVIKDPEKIAKIVLPRH